MGQRGHAMPPRTCKISFKKMEMKGRFSCFGVPNPISILATKRQSYVQAGVSYS